MRLKELILPRTLGATEQKKKKRRSPKKRRRHRGRREKRNPRKKRIGKENKKAEAEWGPREKIRVTRPDKRVWGEWHPYTTSGQRRGWSLGKIPTGR